MAKKIIVLLLLVISSCSRYSVTQISQLSISSPIATTIPTNIPQFTNTPTQSVTAMPIVTPSETPTPSQNASAHLGDQINITTVQMPDRCLLQRVVSFDYLDIPSEYRLLVLPGNAYRIENRSESFTPLIFSPGDPDPKTMEGSNSKGIWYSSTLHKFSRVSPDHRWFYYFRPEDDKKYKMIWISSSDGKEQWPLIQIDIKNSAVWANNQEIFIIGKQSDEIDDELTLLDYFPIASVNIYSMEQNSLKYIADYQLGRVADKYLNIRDNRYVLYSEVTEFEYGLNYYIYDYDDDQIFTIFPWLMSKEVDPGQVKLSFLPIWVYDGGNRFALSLDYQGKGIDLVMGLDIETAQQNKAYNEVMRRVLLPERLTPPDILGMIPVRNQFAIQRFDVFSTSSPNWFYTLDAESMTITDYCLDLVDAVTNVKFSPDGRFAAITLERYPPPVNQAQYYILLLDLDNGAVAYLEDYVVVDWGVIPASE